MKRSLIAFGLVVSFAAGVSAQDKRYVDYKTYPADFNTIQIGQPVDGKPGFFWGHDGSWYMVELTKSTQVLTPLKENPLIESLKRGLDWVCFNWEDDGKVMAGGHPDVILVSDRPATADRDRQICLAFEKVQ